MPDSGTWAGSFAVTSRFAWKPSNAPYKIRHAIDAEGQLGESGSVEHLPRQEMLRPKAQESTAMLDQVHGRGPEETRDKIVGGVVVNLAWSSDLSELAIVDNRDAIAHAHGLDLVVRDVNSGRSHPLLELPQLTARACPQLRVQIGQRFI